MSAATRAVSRAAPPRLPRGTLQGGAVAAAAALLALWLAREAGVSGPGAVPEVVRAAGAAAAIFWISGYAPARLLLPDEMRAHTLVLAFPLGAATSALALTVLGFLRVPFEVSVPLVLATGAAAGLWLRVRQGPARAPEGSGGAGLRVLWPAYLAVLLAAVALLPLFRSGFATIVGQNGDAHLAVGTAELLQEAPPNAVRPELPVDRVPLVWRSKYPIYYSLAAVAWVAGVDTLEVLATFAAAMLALIAVAFFALARHGLGAPPAAALLAMALVGLDRISVYVTDHPYYNQLWASFSLPLILLFGVRYLEQPGRATLALFALFAVLGAAAYPLMLPFPLLVLALAAWLVWRRRRAAGEPLGWIAALRLPRGRRSLALWIPLGVVALALAPTLARGVVEKAVTAAEVVVPWGDLFGWRGALGYLPLGRFFGLPDAALWAALGVPLVVALAAYGLWRAPRSLGLPLAVTCAAGVALGAYFRLRQYGDLFYFKTLAFSGMLTVAAAGAGLGMLAERRRLPAAVGAAALVVLFAFGARAEIDETYDQLTPQLLEIRDWSERLPPGGSVRVDLPPDGYQLWAVYMLADRPVSALRPLTGTFFPYPPRGRKADYLLTRAQGSVSPDATGAPLLANDQYRLYRMRERVPGRDVSSQRLVEPVESISLD
jgi:hypothetical protein